MYKQLLNLLKIKSLFSLVAMLILTVGFINDKFSGEFVAGIISMIVTSYFKKGDNE